MLPLQLNSDAQIKDHSRFAGMAEAADYVMNSFAVHAPAAAQLVIKNHPLDAGLSDYPKVIAGLERRFGLAGRVVYLESGDLDALLRRAAGLVTVNITAGGVPKWMRWPPGAGNAARRRGRSLSTCATSPNCVAGRRALRRTCGSIW